MLIKRVVSVFLYFILMGAILSAQSLPKEKTISFEIDGEKFSLKMVLIPAGTFTMGAVVDSDAEEDEFPAHVVELTHPYYISVTEITQSLWKAVMGYNPSYFYLGEDDKIWKNRPVEQVSWYEVTRFLNKLSEIGGYQLCYSDDGEIIYYDREGFRLPTEAEWEWAAYGGKKQKFVCGDDSEHLKEYAYFDMFMTGETKVVAQKHPNAYGLFDMAGNVFEWCNDWYGEYKGQRVKDPHGPSAGKKKVIRGGGFGSPDYDLRCTNRGKGDPDGNFSDVGFRVVLPVLNLENKKKEE